MRNRYVGSWGRLSMFWRLGLADEGCWPRLVRVQSRRDLASDGLQNPLKVNGSTRWPRGRLAGLSQPSDSCNYDFRRTISKVWKHTAGNDTENYFELEQLVGGRQSTTVFEAADLTVASVAEQMRQISLAQACPASQQPNVWSFSVSFRSHTFRQPSFFYSS
jgi:hypothetical protein